MLSQGSKNYVVDDKYADSDDWRKGARDMAEGSKAKEYDAPVTAGGSSPFYSASETGSAPSAPVPGGSTSKQVERINNLDSIMTDRLKKEAQKEGVRY